MPLRKCSGLCTSHFGFPKRYETNTVENHKRYNRERMRAWRKGIKSLPKPSYKTHYYCKICEVWIPQGSGFIVCPCCFNKLKGLKIATIILKEHFLKVLLYSSYFIALGLLIYCIVTCFVLWWILFL